MKLARCARSDSHSVRALRAVKSHPFGAGLHSNGRGAAPVLDCSFSGGAAQTHFKTFLCTSRGVKCGAYYKVCWCGPTSFARLSLMPVEVLCRRFAAPLFVTIILTRYGDRWGFSFYSYCLGFRVPCAVRFAHWGAGLHLSQYVLCQCRGFFPFSLRKKIFLIRRDAPSRLPRFPASFFPRPCMGSAFFPCLFLAAAAFFSRFVPFPRKVLYNEGRYIKISIKEGFS